MKEKQKKAVAIKYDKAKDESPKVVAKGKSLIAERIERIAKESNIYVKKDESLTDELYRLKINEEIPEELYEAIAQILVFVYKMQASDYF